MDSPVQGRGALMEGLGARHPISRGDPAVRRSLRLEQSSVDFPPVAGHSGYAAIVDGDGLRVA